MTQSVTHTYTPAGIVAGLHNMATHYFAGKGVEHSFPKAAEYFQQASDLGFAPSQVTQLN